MRRNGPLKRNTPLKRAGHLRSTGRLPAASARKVRDQHARQALVLKVLTERPTCEVRVRGCEGRSVDVHEPRTRARGGSHLDESNTLAVCRSCHEWIHHFPGEATRLRFLIHSWDPS